MRGPKTDDDVGRLSWTNAYAKLWPTRRAALRQRNDHVGARWQREREERLCRCGHEPRVRARLSAHRVLGDVEARAGEPPPGRAAGTGANCTAADPDLGLAGEAP